MKKFLSEIGKEIIFFLLIFFAVIFGIQYFKSINQINEETIISKNFQISKLQKALKKKPKEIITIKFETRIEKGKIVYKDKIKYIKFNSGILNMENLQLELKPQKYNFGVYNNQISTPNDTISMEIKKKGFIRTTRIGVYAGITTELKLALGMIYHFNRTFSMSFFGTSKMAIIGGGITL